MVVKSSLKFNSDQLYNFKRRLNTDPHALLQQGGMLLISGTGNGERGTGNRERESGNECTAVSRLRIQNGGRNDVLTCVTFNS